MIKDTLARMRTMSEVELHRPATEPDIKKAERMLALKFPSDYREFLKTCGWASIGSDEVYGLGPDAEKATDVYENAATEHVMAEPQMRAELVPLMNDGMGNHYCLDTDQTKDGVCPVVFWQHDHPKGEMQKARRVAASFTAWLDKLLEDLGND